MFPVLLSYDPYIREFLDRRPPKLFDALNAEYRIIEKLGLQSVSNEWRNDLSLILPQERRTVASSASLQKSDRGYAADGFINVGPMREGRMGVLAVISFAKSENRSG